MKNIALTTASIMVVNAAAIGVLSTISVAMPILSGTYRCEPYPAQCYPDTMYTVVQDGHKLGFTSNKGDVANGELTSDISVSVGAPWNMVGTIHEGAIEWSNGTNGKSKHNRLTPTMIWSTSLKSSIDK
jgi:hypothetical protein